MATARVIAQLSPAAATVTDAYVAGAGLTNVRVLVSNTGAGELLYRIGVAPNGAADDATHWFINDEPLGAEGSESSSGRTPPLLLHETDVIRVYTNLATLNVLVNGLVQT